MRFIKWLLQKWPKKCKERKDRQLFGMTTLRDESRTQPDNSQPIDLDTHTEEEKRFADTHDGFNNEYRDWWRK